MKLGLVTNSGVNFYFYDLAYIATFDQIRFLITSFKRIRYFL
jgi:hypothetical protein